MNVVAHKGPTMVSLGVDIEDVTTFAEGLKEGPIPVLKFLLLQFLSGRDFRDLNVTFVL